MAGHAGTSHLTSSTSVQRVSAPPPVQPAAQLQVNSFTPSEQLDVPPQSTPEHSSMSTSQVAPE
jgi:hypothetical protein